MIVTHCFETHQIRAVMIEGAPWLVGPDLAACLDLPLETATALTGGDHERLWYPLAETGAPVPCFSVPAALRLATAAPTSPGERFERWLTMTFDCGTGFAAPRPASGCDHFNLLSERLDNGLAALDGLIALVGSIAASGGDLHEIEPRGLIRLLNRIRDDFEATETIVNHGCRRANGRQPLPPRFEPC